MHSKKGFLLTETMAVLLLAVVLCSLIFKMYGTCILWMQKQKTIDEGYIYLQHCQYYADDAEPPQGLQFTENVREADGFVIKEMQLKKGNRMIMNLIWTEDE